MEEIRGRIVGWGERDQRMNLFIGLQKNINLLILFIAKESGERAWLGFNSSRVLTWKKPVAEKGQIAWEPEALQCGASLCPG